MSLTVIAALREMAAAAAAAAATGPACVAASSAAGRPSDKRMLMYAPRYCSADADIAAGDDAVVLLLLTLRLKRSLVTNQISVCFNAQDRMSFMMHRRITWHIEPRWMSYHQSAVK